MNELDSILTLTENYLKHSEISRPEQVFIAGTKH